MINKKTMVILLIGVMVAGLLVFNQLYTRTFEEAMSKSNVSFDKILHTIETDKGSVVFYKDLDQLYVGLIEKTITGYEWVFGAGSESFSSDNDIEFGYSNIGKSSRYGSKEAFPLVTGTLMNEEIKEVQVVLRDEEPKEANIVSTDGGVFWYLLLDKQIDYTPEVIGLGNEGNLIYPKDQSQELQVLEGENVFNPTKIKVGDKVQGLVLTKIQVVKGTRDYPIDTLTANFKGKVILSGTMTLLEKDNDFYFDDLLLFKPDMTSSKKLPISHHESPNRPMVFENQGDAISILGIEPGESKEITIEIENYTINFLPTDALNSVKLIRVIK